MAAVVTRRSLVARRIAFGVLAVASVALWMSRTYVYAQQPAAAIATPHADRDLRGAIDIHIHAEPDENARSVDGIEAARFAAQHAMRAIVLKNHWDSTAGLAWLARKAVPNIEVFGGID